MNDWMAYVIVAAMIAWSCHVVLRRFMPKTTFRLQQALSQQLASWGLQRVAKWVQPQVSQGGCASGCSSCGSQARSCDNDVVDKNNEQPVQWRPSTKK